MDHRRAALTAALGFLRLPATEPELRLLQRWLDTWAGRGLIVTGMQRQGWDLQLYGVWRWALAGDVLRHRDGPFNRRRVGVAATPWRAVQIAGRAAAGRETLE